mmetsp:Transcript_26950/g.26029  ORF Transcript_26950/g.26029 Transcript_26950/m.26029 type:complete len:290 (-) Transcript_26950:22-891(-)
MSVQSHLFDRLIEAPYFLQLLLLHIQLRDLHLCHIPLRILLVKRFLFEDFSNIVFSFFSELLPFLFFFLDALENSCSFQLMFFLFSQSIFFSFLLHLFSFLLYPLLQLQLSLPLLLFPLLLLFIDPLDESFRLSLPLLLHLLVLIFILLREFVVVSDMRHMLDNAKFFPQKVHVINIVFNQLLVVFNELKFGFIIFLAHNIRLHSQIEEQLFKFMSDQFPFYLFVALLAIRGQVNELLSSRHPLHQVMVHLSNMLFHSLSNYFIVNCSFLQQFIQLLLLPSKLLPCFRD